ncbi:MAG: hypothetical protein C0592_08155 [Marinilabiliales bacterium]|nr:MAG: hypothetical protein C0592_08155 [Marinilabiliales bacterium]
MKTIFTIISIFAFAAMSFGQASDDCNGCTPQPLNPKVQTVQNDAKGLLYDNGDFVTGIDPTGPDSSILQGANNTLGGNFKNTLGYSIADDFTIASGSWQVDSIVVYGYQTGSPTTSPFTGLFIRIYDGDPAGSGTVVWGDTTTNILSDTYWTEVYRASSTWGTTRPIMALTAATPTLTLTAGTYWIDVQTEGSASYSGPWCAPVTIAGVENTGDDGYQRNGSVFNPWLDSGTSYGLGLPFKIYGSTVSNIEENTDETRIYPNPSNSIINIEAGEQITKVIVYDQMGTAVNTVETPGTSAQIETSNMNPGVYHILIETATGISSTQIVVE